ncbi:MAG: hypothetical protein ACREHG_09450, partial [Candidatus Saccharimonadales bacterium]
MRRWWRRGRAGRHWLGGGRSLAGTVTPSGRVNRRSRGTRVDTDWRRSGAFDLRRDGWVVHRARGRILRGDAGTVDRARVCTG